MFKRKKIFFYFLSVIVLTIHIFRNGTVVQASDKETLSSGAVIEKVNGRVAPIKSPRAFEENDLNVILEEIGYPEKLINTWSINRKRKLASYGGDVVDSANSELVHEYISLDGKKYVITPENHKEIRELQINDLKKIGVKDNDIEEFNILKDSSMSTMRLIQDGKWSAELMTVKIDETAHDYKYLMMLDYYWEKHPVLNPGDSMGMHWGHYGQPVAQSARGMNAINYASSGNWITYDHSLDLSSNYGIVSTVDTYPNGEIYGPQMGFLEEEVWISKDYEGHNLALSAKYVHPWLPNALSLSVDYSGISLSGDLSLGDQWSWRHNFIPTP